MVHLPTEIILPKDFGAENNFILKSNISFYAIFVIVNVLWLGIQDLR